jgi:hypothetical protein
LKMYIMNKGMQTEIDLAVKIERNTNKINNDVSFSY